MAVVFHPVKPKQVPAHPWLFDQLLPRNEIVFLDGPTGVGKSALIAHFVSAFATHPLCHSDQKILYVSSDQQGIDRDHHLRVQQVDYGSLTEIYFDSCYDEDEGEELLTEFVTCLQEHLTAKPMFLVIIDDLEEILGHASQVKASVMATFWYKMQRLAQEHQVTFLIPRRHGLHENRCYGPYVLQGNNCSRFILTLQYHQFDPLQRVLSVAKHNYGPTGEQWHLHFDASGKIELSRAEKHQVVRPSKTLQPWQPDPSQLRDDEVILEAADTYMNGQAVPKQELLKHIVELGFSKRQFREVMSRAKLPEGRQGTTWVYLPTAGETSDPPRVNAARARARELAA